jgi:hypothetical protein
VHTSLIAQYQPSLLKIVVQVDFGNNTRQVYF